MKKLVKARIKRLNEKFEMFHEDSQNRKKRMKCYRLEIGALLSKANILMARESNKQMSFRVLKEFFIDNVKPLLTSAAKYLDRWYLILESMKEKPGLNRHDSTRFQVKSHY